MPSFVTKFCDIQYTYICSLLFKLTIYVNFILFYFMSLYIITNYNYLYTRIMEIFIHCDN